MERGNEILEEAQEHQKGGTKCLLWIVIILVIVAVAVILIVLSQTVWKKKPSPAPASPTLGPQWF
jgi:flagellar basal body-associated protein FliL